MFLFPVAALATSSIVINEISSGSSTSDWVEIYNTSTESVDISKYRIRDSTTSNKKNFSGSLASQQFASLGFDDNLNNSGDKVRLIFFEGENETLIEEIPYGTLGGICAPPETESIGKKPDGSQITIKLANQSRDISNNSVSESPCPSPTPTITPTPSPTPKPDPTNTPAPTSGPTSTPKPPTVIPTKKPTSIPTLKPTESEEFINGESSLEDQLLGASASAENIDNPSPAPEITNKPKTKSAIHPVPIIVIGLGVLLMIGGSAPLLLQYLKNRKSPHSPF